MSRRIPYKSCISVTMPVFFGVVVSYVCRMVFTDHRSSFKLIRIVHASGLRTTTDHHATGPEAASTSTTSRLLSRPEKATQRVTAKALQRAMPRATPTKVQQRATAKTAMMIHRPMQKATPRRAKARVAIMTKAKVCKSLRLRRNLQSSL